MPWRAPSPVDLYGLLPKTNCGKCGEANCMAFAVKLVNLEASAEQCPPIVEDPKYRQSYQKLKELVSPLVKEVVLRGPRGVIKIGGEYVLHRHELKYINPTAIAIDVDDSMSRDEIINKVKAIEGFSYEYIGRKLTLDLIAVRSVAGDPEAFARAVKIVTENSSLPIVLCSLNPRIVEAGLRVLSPDYRPLIYAATKDNWREMGELARKFETALAVSSPGDLDMLVSLAKTLSDSVGISDLALDPGCFIGKGGLAYTIKAFTHLRYKAVEQGFKYAAYPLVATPISVWTSIKGDAKAKAWWESIMAITLVTRYADIVILHSIDGWVLLPLVLWRFNLYTDPRIPVAVEPGLRIIGQPNEMSPVFITGNYALTYSIVSSDIEKARIDSYLLVIDTEGIAIEAAVPGRKLTAEKIAEAIKAYGIDGKVKHKILIIPGRAARLSGDIEDATGWRVMVGPMDSRDIPGFMQKHWVPEKIEELMGRS
ncbi:MAG: acetyl-CoA decarbonylase/synthase complex subunit gamma [Desulfurococcaceae archaeon]